MAEHHAYSLEAVKRETLHLDPSMFIHRSDYDDSTSGSPNSTGPGYSPISQGNFSSARDSESEMLEHEERIRHSRSASSVNIKKEKRKRSRVTPEQLVKLERLFLLDRSPPAARRREISELLGMHERQTQIWFQNRRAKAKLQENKFKHDRENLDPPPDTPPQLSAGVQLDLYNLIHENEPVTIIPCTELSIGSWRRVVDSATKHDLIAYVCDPKRSLTWYIYSLGFGFKMEIPFETIADTEFKQVTSKSGLATFVLSQPPIFYLENIETSPLDGSNIRHWKRCQDWTENQQATHELRHNLTGSSVQLVHLLQNLCSIDGSENTLRPPSHHSRQSSSPTVGAEPPPPSVGSGCHYQHDVAEPPPHNQTLFRKRLTQTVPITNTSVYAVENNRPPPPYSAPAGNHSFPPHQSYAMPASCSTVSAYMSGSDLIDPTSQNLSHNVGCRNAELVNKYFAVQFSHGQGSRRYSAPVFSHGSYSEAPLQLGYPYRAEELEPIYPLETVGQVVTHFDYDQNLPSPPLLTTPYQPPPHLLQGSLNRPVGYLESVPAPAAAGLPNGYQVADYTHHP